MNKRSKDQGGRVKFSALEKRKEKLDRTHLEGKRVVNNENSVRRGVEGKEKIEAIG